MCFGSSRDANEAVIIKKRVRPRPSYDERIYVQEPTRLRNRNQYERERSVSRSRYSRDDRREARYDDRRPSQYAPSQYSQYDDPRRSSRVVQEERRVSRHYTRD